MKIGREQKFEIRQALLETYAANERANQILLKQLDERAWRAKPPDGQGRTIAAIVAHMHNVRVMYLKMAKARKIPQQLTRHSVARKEAQGALAQSHRALEELLAESLAGTGKIKSFPPNAVAFVGRLICHDAHHRGQICMLSRQAGYPLSQLAQLEMWDWSKLSKRQK
jgi:uncharacterized damage-inducible protein DinB